VVATLDRVGMERYDVPLEPSHGGLPRQSGRRPHDRRRRGHTRREPVRGRLTQRQSEIATGHAEAFARVRVGGVVKNLLRLVDE